MAREVEDTAMVTDPDYTIGRSAERFRRCRAQRWTWRDAYKYKATLVSEVCGCRCTCTCACAAFPILKLKLHILHTYILLTSYAHWYLALTLRLTIDIDIDDDQLIKIINRSCLLSVRLSAVSFLS